MKRWVGLTAVVALAMLSSQSPVTARDHDRDRNRSFKASLIGFEEPPAISSPGHGRFEARISRDGESFDYKLSYGDLAGPVTQAHIHMGLPSVNGGIAIWLCQTAAVTVPAGAGMVPLCPTPGGTVEGTVTAAQVLGPTAQFFPVGEFGEVVRGLRNGAGYANVHTTRNPGGEIRGQIQVDDDDHGRGDHDH